MVDFAHCSLPAITTTAVFITIFRYGEDSLVKPIGLAGESAEGVSPPPLSGPDV
jgi:hypothetical protein